MEDTSSEIIDTNFLCIYCRQKLQYPIRKVKNVGNFCSSCITKSQHSESEENVEFQAALLNIIMPCKYSYRGCSKNAKFTIVSQHEKKCIHRDKVCPYAILEKCNEENIQNITQHFMEYHPIQVNVLETNNFELNYEIEKELNEFYIIMFKDCGVSLNLKVIEEKLLFTFYSLGNGEEVKDFRCRIQNRNDFIGTHEKITKINRNEFIDTYNDTNTIDFDIKILENHFGRNLTTSVTLQRENAKISNEKVIEQLECPVCNNFMKSNIMLCSMGHSVCKLCQSRLDKCPICMYPFGGARNYTLESLSELFDVKTIVKYECPLRKELQCPWKGMEQNILEHVKDLHRNVIVVNNSLTTKIQTLAAEFSEINYLMTFGQVFKMTCRKDKYDDIMMVMIELIGHDEDAQKYNYNISLSSMYKQNIIWYTKSKVLTRRRIEYHADYLAIGRTVCNNQFNISYGIIKNIHY